MASKGTSSFKKPTGNNSSLQKLAKEDRTMRLRFSIAFVAMTAWPSVLSWTLNNSSQNKENHHGHQNWMEAAELDAFLDSDYVGLNRRAVLTTFSSAAFAMAALIPPATAADSTKPQEFKNVGTQAPPPDGDSPFVTLANGVKIKDFKLGGGDSSVTPSSRVSIQCSGRLLNLNGVVFYNTKNNNPDGFGAIPLTIDLGQGQAVKGLEAGLVGMKKGGIRRIIVPQELAYNQNPDLEPKPMNANDQRALDSVVKNSRRDGAILFDVQVERFK